MTRASSNTLPPFRKLSGNVLALCGGVGGAKLALGLSHCIAPDQLRIVVNTADDFEYLDFPVSPDLDTVMYTLAGIANQQQGWGLQGETWQFMQMLQQLGEQPWFQLGDKDIAVHTQRRMLLQQGKTLTQVTHQLCAALDVKHSIIPMSDDSVRTMINTDQGELPFQGYFVKQQCKPVMTGWRYAGIDQATPSQAFIQALDDSDLAAIVICPSNPYVSIGPILSLPTIQSRIRELNIPVLAVSPIVAGQSVKGPLAKMLHEQNQPVSPVSVMSQYQQVLSHIVVDDTDAELVTSQAFHSIAGLENVSAVAMPTMMKTLDDKIALADAILRCLHLYENDK